MGKHRLSYLAALVAVGIAAALVFAGNVIAQPTALGASHSAAKGATASNGTVMRPNACTEPPGCCPIAMSTPRTVIPAGTPTCGTPGPVLCHPKAHDPVHVVLRDPETGEYFHIVKARGEVNCDSPVIISILVILSKNGREIARKSDTTRSAQVHFEQLVSTGCVTGTGGQYHTTVQYSIPGWNGRDDSDPPVAIVCS